MMTKHRRFLALILALVMMLGMFPPAALAAEEVQGAEALPALNVRTLEDPVAPDPAPNLGQVYANTAVARHVEYLIARYPLTYETQGQAFDAAGNRLPTRDATPGAGAEWHAEESAGGALYLGGQGRTQSLQFPTGMLDGAALENEDTLTISFWSRRMSPAGIANAFFLGTPAGEGITPDNMPNNYVVINPAKLYGPDPFTSATRYHYTLAARMTNVAGPGVPGSLHSPWTREVGLQGEAGARRYTERWTQYAVVLTPTSFEFFVDGRQIGTTMRDEPLVRDPGNLVDAAITHAFSHITQSKQSTLSDYGTGLEIFLGMSNYLNDPTFHGYFGDVEFYSAAFNARDMHLLYEAQRERFFPAPAPTVDGPFLMSYTLPLGSSSGSGWTGANYGVAAANVYSYMGIYDNSLHIAYSMDGVDWTPLNDNRGILYRRTNAAWTGDATGTWSEYVDPFIYQLQCGNFVMVATALNRDQVLASGNIMVSSSPDLLNWSPLRILPTDVTGGGAAAVSNRPRQPRIVQAENGDVRVYWVRNTNMTDRYQVAVTTAANLISGNETLVGTATTDGGAAWEGAFNSVDVDVTRAPAGAAIGNAVSITNAQLEAIQDRWATPEFDTFTVVTTADAVANFDALPGLPTYGTISLADGAQYFYGTGRDRDLAYEEPGSRWVDWVRTADLTAPGTYEVEGFVRYDFWNPLNLNGADPAITKCHITGRFYYIASDKDLVNPGRANYQYRRIWLVGPADTIGELRSMADEVSFTQDQDGRPVRGERLPLRPTSGLTATTGPNQFDHPFKRVVYDPIWGNTPFNPGPGGAPGGPSGSGMDDPNVNLWAPEMRWVEFGDCDCRELGVCGYYDCEGNVPSVSCRHKTADPVQCVHDGRWVIHHGGAPNRGSQWQIRMWTMYNRSLNPMEGEWSRPRYLADGDDTTFNLDANTFEHRGEWWIMHVSTQGVPSSPRTARMHNFQTMYGHDGAPLHPLPGAPATADNRSVGNLQFPVMPAYNWEQRANRVLEGTTMMWANGRLWLNYAAASTDASYVIGFAYADVNATDLADGANWSRIGHPIMQLSPDTSQYGPGHSMFTESETITAPNGHRYSFPVLSYHARQTNTFRNDPLQEPTRFQRIAPVYFHRDGTPYLGQPANNGWAPGRPLRGTVIVAANENERQMLAGLHGFDLHRSDDVRGNMTLPTTYGGTSLSWQSSHPAVVAPNGVVTRPVHGADNVIVTLTVTGTQNGYTAERELQVVVKPEPPSEPLTRAVKVAADYVTLPARAGYQGFRSHYRTGDTYSIGFLYTSSTTVEGEWDPLMSRNFYAIQCSFGLAGTEYHAFTETIGSGSVYDPVITKSPDGDMFYVIGSDKTAGNLAVWESRDLFTFADQRLVHIPGAGIIETPDVFWDDVSGSYVVRWVSGSDRFSATTRDFVTFTAATPYAGTWVTPAYSYVELTTAQFDRVAGTDTVNQSTSLASLEIAGERVNLALSAPRIAVEATTITTADVVYVLAYMGATANVTVTPDNGDYIVTVEVTSDYGTRTYTVRVDLIRLPQTPIVHFDFEGDAGNRINNEFGAMTLFAPDGTHRAFVTEHGTAPSVGNNSYLRLQNTTARSSHNAGRARFPDGVFDGREQVTIAMDVYTTLADGFFFTFALQPVGSTTFSGSEGRYFLNRIRGSGMRNAITVSGWGANESGVDTPGWGTNTWSRVTLVFDDRTMMVYVNGELVDYHGNMNSSIADLCGGAGLWAYLGRAPMAGDRAFDGGFDNIKVWDYALGTGEVLAEFRANNPAPAPAFDEVPGMGTMETILDGVAGIVRDVVESVKAVAEGTVEVTFDLAQGQNPADFPMQEVSVGGFVTEPVSQPTREGYRFGGWHREVVMEAHLIITSHIYGDGDDAALGDGVAYSDTLLPAWGAEYLAPELRAAARTPDGLDAATGVTNPGTLATEADDALFLLSASEVEAYFDGFGGVGANGDRLAAHATCEAESVVDWSWWLRSLGETGFRQVVNGWHTYLGAIAEEPIARTFYTGFRPALWVEGSALGALASDTFDWASTSTTYERAQFTDSEGIQWRVLTDVADTATLARFDFETMAVYQDTVLIAVWEPITSVRVDDENTTVTIPIDGEGEIELEYEAPAGVTVTVNDDGTITITGVRPDYGTNPIEAEFDIVVTRNGTTTTLQVTVNLTPTAQLPVITVVGPTDVAVTFGAITETLTVTATVTEGATLSYRWERYVDGTWEAVPSATGAEFPIPTDLAVGSHQFRVVVSATGGAASVTSRTATVTVAAPVVGTHTVRWELGDGGEWPTGFAPQTTVPHGGTIVAPTATPTRAGYTFTGWDRAFPITNVTGNVTVTAQWTAVPPIHVPVTGITNVPDRMVVGDELELTGTVAPANATNRDIVWSTTTPGASIEDGVLTTTRSGPVVVTATIVGGSADGTDFVQEFTIIARAFHAAYMFGNPAGQFLPGNSITRAEVAAILARTMIDDFDSSVDRAYYELPDGMDSFTVFPDVSESNWFYHYVAWAHYEGFVQGDAQGRFNPTSPITRQELAAMLARTIGEDDRLETGDMAFPDASTIGGWARGYVYNVFRQGWMVGDANGNFRPTADIMRAEVATAVNRLLGRVDTNVLRNALVADDALEHESRARVFPDVAASNWFFAAVLGAANDHYLTHNDEGVVDWMYVREEQPWR